MWPWLVWQVRIGEDVRAQLDKAAGVGRMATICCKVQIRVKFYETDLGILSDRCGARVWTMGVGAIERTRTRETVKYMY